MTEQLKGEVDQICTDLRLSCIEAFKDKPIPPRWVRLALLLVSGYGFFGMFGLIPRRKLGISLEDYLFPRKWGTRVPDDRYGSSERIDISVFGTGLSEKTKVIIETAKKPSYLLLKREVGEIRSKKEYIPGSFISVPVTSGPTASWGNLIGKPTLAEALFYAEYTDAAIQKYRGERSI